MKENVLISIIISTRNKPWEIVSKSLDSILASNFKNFEIILIDQNETQEIGSRIKSEKKYRDIFYLKSKEVGLSKGRNLGIKYSKGKWLLFFDDDAILSKDFFEKIKTHLKENQEKEIIFYGKVLNLEDGSPYLKRSIKTSYLHLWNFDSVCSIALIFNKKAIEKIGYFDESFGVGSRFGAGEEGDMIIRALKKGIKIKYLKDFIVYHPKAKIDLKKKYLYGYGLGALYRKHIFTSFKCFLVLKVKFILEIIIRTILSIFFAIVDFQKSQLHFSYLKGFIKGFFSKSSK